MITWEWEYPWLTSAQERLSEGTCNMVLPLNEDASVDLDFTTDLSQVLYKYPKP